MTICLIMPSSPFLLDDKVFPALGVLKVAASLRQAGHTVDMLDLSGEADELGALYTYVSRNPGVTFGITATSPQMPAAMRILKALPPDARVILGGPHVTLVHAAARNEARRNTEGRATLALKYLTHNFKTLVVGDGERAVHRAIRNGRGIIDADDPGNDLFLSSKDFEDAPWPARDLIDLTTYHYQLDGESATSIITQLACPFACNFCAGRNSAMLRRVRRRSPENVLAEMVHLHETYGYKGFMFLDDELNVNRSLIPLMYLLYNEAERRGIQWKLRGFLKAELFTPEQATAMVAAGFTEVLIGFESADDRILVNIDKKATLTDNTKAMAIAHDAGLGVKALMSIGHPGETEQSVKALRDWLVEVKPADFDCTIITPYPGCNYYDHAIPQNGHYVYSAPKTQDQLLMEDVDFTQNVRYYKGVPGNYISHVWTPALSQQRIVELRDWVEEDVRRKLGISFYSERIATPH